jgi:hypothetical protein
MKKRLTNVTVNKKTPLEKLAATQEMLTCKSFEMTLNMRDYFNMTCGICLSKIEEVMLNNETNISKSVP